MPTNTLDKIRHSLSCVAVLFGLFGIFVFASFSPSYAGFIWEVWLRLLYIVLFLSMRLPHGVFIQVLPVFIIGSLIIRGMFCSGAGQVPYRSLQCF